MSDKKIHTGGCHCGAVRYEVNMELNKPMACNCSMCGRTGTLLVFVPEKDFTLLSGEASLTNYQFNKKMIDHLFCKVCGVKSFGRGSSPDGAKMIAINVRCLDDIDLEQLDVQHFDGKSL